MFFVIFPPNRSIGIKENEGNELVMNRSISCTRGACLYRKHALVK